MRLVYFGSGEFGLPTLEALIAGAHPVVAVVTQPPRPAGRGGKTKQTPVHAVAAELDIPVRTPEKPNTPEFRDELAALEPDLAVVVAYGHLIRPPLLSVPRHGFINLHASLLPAYRGAAPVPWAILNGEEASGVTVFQLDERFDTGAILGKAALPIADDDTAGTYLERLSLLGPCLVSAMVESFALDRVITQPQDDAKASKAPKLRKEDGIIDWNRPWREIERKVRAFQPWPLASATLATAKGPLRVNVLKLLPSAIESTSASPGDILAADAANGLVIMAQDAPVRVARLQPEGKRAMEDTEFLRGTRLAGLY